MEKVKRIVKTWVEKHLAGLFIFNISVILMVLLNTAQYFKPFFYLGINLIFFLSLLFAVLFLGARAKAMFGIALIFLVFSAFLKVVKIDVWADRASIYFYQSFFIGLMLLLILRERKS